ncbi:hypothetical protein QBC39DRAFT_404088 [Podospora conica]|nr:hypothetical protein QBC39DRAFT_404088 [Schizothecium conicum]
MEDSTSKPFHSKRPHRKSRAGCRNCKTRKVKCDEAHPVCGNCSQRMEACSYLKPHLDSSSSSSTSPPPPSSTATTTTTIIRHPLAAANPPSPISMLQEPLFLPADRSPLDLQLLHHYETSTYSSLSSWSLYDPTIHSLLRTTILREALAVPFLMDALLGLSAMHLARLAPSSPSTPSPSTTSLFRARAFSGFRHALTHPTRHQTALLATSIILCALSSSTFTSSPLYILSWPTLWRGIGLVLNLAPPSFAPPPGLTMLFYRPPVDLDAAARHIPSPLLFMLTARPADPDTPVYYAALQRLGTLYAELDATGLGPQLDLRVITFLTHLSEEFSALARRRERRAAVVLAHYLVFMKLTRAVWWMEDVPRRELGPLCELICAGDEEAGGGTFWAELARVPRAAMGMERRVDVVGLLLGRAPAEEAEAGEDAVDGVEYEVKTKKLWKETGFEWGHMGTPLEDVVRGMVRHPGEGEAWRHGGEKGRSEVEDGGLGEEGDGTGWPWMHGALPRRSD